jgi:hypothetical protein
VNVNPKQGGNGIGGAVNASENHSQMQRMQAEKLQHNEEQEEHSGTSRVEQILSFLPQAHRAQRNKVECRMIF